MPLDPAVRRWAYEELPEFPEDEGHRYEYIAGELVASRFSCLLHQEVLGRLLIQMKRYTDANQLGRVYLGPIGILFAIGDYMAPDLAFVRADRGEIVGERSVEAAPDLVVEIVHEVTERWDRGIKRERYAMYGVAAYWIVDPEKKQVDLYHLAEGAEVPMTLTSGTFIWEPVPGGPVLEIDLEELFRDLD